MSLDELQTLKSELEEQLRHVDVEIRHKEDTSDTCCTSKLSYPGIRMESDN